MTHVLLVIYYARKIKWYYCKHTATNRFWTQLIKCNEIKIDFNMNHLYIYIYYLI